MSASALEREIRSCLPNGPTAGRVAFVSYGKAASVYDLPQSQCFKTISAAYTTLRAGYGDTIVLLDDGTTAGMDRETATLAWNKADTHLVGANWSTKGEARTSIRTLSTATGYSPLITVSADGCSFWNIGTFHAPALSSATYVLEVTSNRCKFVNCGFQGMGDSTSAGQAGSDVYIHGGQENEFTDCLIGLTTIQRTSATECNIKFDASAARNRFLNCRIEKYAGNAGQTFVRDGGSSTTDRYQEFNNCVFFNSVGSGATDMTSASAWNSSSGGVLIFRNCDLVAKLAMTWGPSQANVFAKQGTYSVFGPLA